MRDKVMAFQIKLGIRDNMDSLDSMDKNPLFGLSVETVKGPKEIERSSSKK